MALNLDIQEWRLRVACKVFFSASLTYGDFWVGVSASSKQVARFGGNMATNLRFGYVHVDQYLSQRGKWLSFEFFKTLDPADLGTYDDTYLTPAIQVMGKAQPSGQYFMIADVNLVADGVSPAIPQQIASAAYTLRASDNGKHIFISTGGVSIPNNSSVPLDPEFVVSIVNNSGSTQTISKGGSVTLYISGDATSKTSLTLAARGICTLLKVGTDTWMASGAVS